MAASGNLETVPYVWMTEVKLNVNWVWLPGQTSLCYAQSLFILRWHQWCPCPTTRGPCLSPNTWSFASTATSTPGGLMPSRVDTPSTKTTTSTSHTTRWWLPSGASVYSVLHSPAADQTKDVPRIKLINDYTVFILRKSSSRSRWCWFVSLVIHSSFTSVSLLLSYTSVRMLEICLPRPKIFIRNLGPSKTNLQQDLKDFSLK